MKLNPGKLGKSLVVAGLLTGALVAVVGSVVSGGSFNPQDYVNAGMVKVAAVAALYWYVLGYLTGHFYNEFK